MEANNALELIRNGADESGAIQGPNPDLFHSAEVGSRQHALTAPQCVDKAR